MIAGVTPRVPRVGLQSFWLQEALAHDPGAPCPPLEGTRRAGVCIVGGGLAGCWTAYELTERDPGCNVVLLEAAVCGAGGSGANGGFFSSSWDDIAGLCTILGEEAGARYATLLARQVDELERWCSRHAADVWFHREGILYAQVDEWQDPLSPLTLQTLERCGAADQIRLVDAEQAQAVARSPLFRGGAVTPSVATVQPARLVRELRRVLLERGVTIYEGTPLIDLRGGRPATVTTPQGSVVADQVAVTTGAWAAASPPFKRAFAVGVDYMVVTEPIPERLAQIGWTSHMGIADSRDALYYLRRTNDDRIAIGGGTMGVAYDGWLPRPALASRRKAAVAAEGLLWMFPQLHGVRFTHAWSGPMDMTMTRLPFFETAPCGTVHAAVGFSGHGLAATKLGGKTMASLLLGSDDEYSRLPVVGPPLCKVPPEPLRWPIVKTVSRLVVNGDLHRQRGGRGGRVGRLASSALEALRLRQGRRRRERLAAGR